MLCISDYEKYARRHLSKFVFDYYYSGADDQTTLRENKQAFTRLRLRPRMLRDVSVLDSTTTVQGDKIAFPIGVAPTAMQQMAHSDGEIGTARAAAQMGTLMILSTLSTTSLEDVVSKVPDNSILWFQLYIYKDRRATEKLLSRAEKCGFKAIVFTVDAPYFGKRLADVRNKFSLPPPLRLANFDVDDLKSTGVASNHGGGGGGSGINQYVASLFDPSISWKDMAWLKSITSLPIIVKGILTAEDALEAKRNGANGIIVSNHGARQLDGVPATIEALPEIIRAVDNSCEVYLDGGVRTGTDVLKALALGARAVFVGRPIIWGLAYQGEAGVQKILQLLKSELDLAMALSGCSSINDITRELVVHKFQYAHL